MGRDGGPGGSFNLARIKWQTEGIFLEETATFEQNE